MGIFNGPYSRVSNDPFTNSTEVGEVFPVALSPMSVEAIRPVLTLSQQRSRASKYKLQTCTCWYLLFSSTVENRQA